MAELKRMRQIELVKQVEAVNLQHKFVLQERVRQDREADQAVLKYNQEKDQREMIRLLEEKAKRDEKEREVQRLREA
jgi:hypothetical protein